MRTILRTRNAVFVPLTLGALLAGCGGRGTDPTGDPGGGGGGSTPGTGTIDLTVSGPTAGANVDGTAYHSTVVTGRKTTSAIGTQLTAFTYNHLAVPNRTVLATMLDAAAPTVGKVYVIGGSNPNTLVYSEVVSTTESHTWSSSGGQMRVTAIDGDKVTLAIEASMDEPAAGAVGSFNLSGTVVIDKVGS